MLYKNDQIKIHKPDRMISWIASKREFCMWWSMDVAGNYLTEPFCWFNGAHVRDGPFIYFGMIAASIS